MLGEPQETSPAVAQNCTMLMAAFWDAQVEAGKSRLFWGGKTLFWETAKAFHYLGAALAALGLFWFRRRLREDAAMWVLLILAVVHAGVLLRMATVIGYISERHTLVFVLIGSLWAAAVVPELARWLGSIRLLARFGAPRWAPIAIVAALLISGVPELLKPGRPSRRRHLDGVPRQRRRRGGRSLLLGPLLRRLRLPRRQNRPAAV